MAVIEKIRSQVEGHPVICGLSGGVDKEVAARLIREAIEGTDTKERRHD